MSYNRQRAKAARATRKRRWEAGKGPGVSSARHATAGRRTMHTEWKRIQRKSRKWLRGE